MVLSSLVLLLTQATFSQTLKPVEVVNTTKLELAAGGTLKVTGSQGQLNIESWDRPEVEITVTRFTESNAKDHDAAKKQVESVTVDAKKTGPNEVTITTPKLHHVGGVSIDYRIRAPKDANLVIQHGTGDVTITGMTGAIDAHAHIGGIFVMVPETKTYSLEAKAKIGTIYSEFEGDRKRIFPAGSSLVAKAGTGAKPLVLVTGNGGVTVQQTTLKWN